MADYDQLMDRALAPKGPGTASTLNDTFGSSMDMYIQRKNQSFLGQVNQAVDVNPDKFNEQRKIAKQLDTVPAAVEALPEDTSRASKVQTLATNTTNAPVLRQQYTDADFAKLAHDDSFSLSSMERVVSDVTKYFMGVGAGQGLIGTIKASPFVAAESFSGVKRATYDLVEPFARALVGPDNIFGNLSKYNAQKAQEFSAMAKSIAQPEQGIVMGGLQSGGQSFLQSSKYLPLALYGGPIGGAVALAGMSLETFGQSYNKAADKNLPLYQTLAYAASDATIEWATEKGPLGALVQNLKAGTPVFISILSNAWKENKGEQVATALQDLNEWATLNPEKPFSDYLDARPAAAAQTAIAVLFGASGNVVLGDTLEKIANHQAKNADLAVRNDMFAQMQPLIDESKLRARDPSVFSQFLAATTDGTPTQDLFISAQTLQQSGVAEQLAAAIPSVAAQLPDALASNGLVRIPTADYAALIAGTPISDAIIEHIKTEPNGYTFAESKQYETSFNQEMQAQLETKLNEAALDNGFKESRDAVRDIFAQQLNTAGRFTNEVNNAYAGLLANFYAVTAAKLGMTPQELVNKYQLNVVNQTQANAQFDQAGDFFYQDGRLMGINVRTDTQAGIRYADEIISGKKVYESRNTDSLRPYVGQRIAIVRTGEGSAKAIGEVTLGEPIVVNEEQFNAMREQHLVPAGSTFDVPPGGVKYLYPVQEPTRYETERDVGQGIVSRQVLNQRGVQEKGRTVPDAVQAVSNVESSFEFAASQSFPTNRDFKLALQGRVLEAAKAAKVNLADFSIATEEYLVRMAYADGITALRTNPNAVGWYNEKVTKALRLVSLVHPEILTDRNAKFAFVWALAVTSNGLKVDKNFDLAEKAYEQWKNSSPDIAKRTMPTDIGIGTASISINKSLGLYNTLIARDGFEAIETFMTTVQTVGEVQKFTGENVSGENKTTQVYGAAALGPKIGNGFFMNLYGHFEQLTMDRWLMRTWGRWTGTLVEVNQAQVKSKRVQLKSLIQSLNPADKKAFEAIIKRKLTIGDIDAVAQAIWKASQKPANRIEMAKIGIAQDADQAAFVEILGDLVKGQRRVSYGDELRKAGNALDKYRDGQNEAPSGPPQRGNIRKVFSQVLLMLQKDHPALTMSDYQALLWYPEKRLYDTAKTSDEATESYEDNEAPDYANAAAKLVRSKGVSDERISSALAAVDAELSANVGARGVQSGTGRQGNSGNGSVLEQAAQVNNAPRGQIFFGNDITQQPSVLALLEKADLSTFLHESGHFFLQVQADLAMRIQSRISAGDVASNAERSIVEDMDRLFNWFGIKADTDVSALDQWAQMSLDEQRKYHEQFARGFEAYLLEGNAPTLELQSLFQKFRSWLLNIYRDLKALDVQLTNEVRGVMDRMVATSQEIATAQDARNMGPLFNPQNGSGLIEDWRAYHDLANDATATAIDQLQAKSMRDMQWLSNAKSRVLKKLQQQHDELRSEIRREVSQGVMSQPIYQVWQFLTARSGEEMVLGQTPMVPESLAFFRGKLDAQILKEMYANEPNINWQALTRLSMTSTKSGLHPEVVAELAGFSSADQMVKALIDVQPPSEVIEAETDQRMLEENGDVADQDAMDRAADAAVHNELRAKMLQTEARALEMAMQVKVDGTRTNAKGTRLSFNVLPKVAREFAQSLILKLKVRDIRPNQYAAAEVRAAKEAERAFSKGDIQAAAEQKRNQIINSYATRAAYDAQDEVRRTVAYLRRFDAKSKGLDADYYDQIAQMLERFDLLATTSLKEIDKRTSLANWLKAQEEAGYKPDVPPALEAEAFRKSYKDMTLEELRGLRDTIQQIEHLGRLKQRLLTAHDQREFDQIRDEMAYSIQSNSKGRKADNRTPNTVLGEKLVSVKSFFAAHIKAATWARIMDGGKDGGPVWEYLIRTANDAGNREVAMRERATRELSALISPVLGQGKLGGKGTFFPAINRSLNKEAILAIALNVGNESNAQRLLGGEGWTIAQIKPVLDTLSTEDWNFVQGVWDYFETYRPDIGAKERRIYGKEPKWIDARSLQVETKDGDKIFLRGGYYPVKFDPRATERAEQHAEAEEAKRMLQGAYTSATTRRSFTKERVQEVNGRPLLYSLDGIYNGINEVIHDLSWHEWLIDANRILKNPKVSDAMRNAYGAEVHQQFKSWVKDVAEGDRGAQNAGEKSLAWIRQGVSVAGLGINVMSALLQPFGITQSIVRIGGAYVGKGLAKFVSDPIGLNAAISEMSEFMRTRSLTQMRELAELRNQVKGQTETRRNVDAAMYALMLRAQQLVDLPTWWGAYEKGIAEGCDLDRSVTLADQAVIDAQGSGTTKDLSAIERGGPAMKLFTVFYSFMNTSLNLGFAQTMTRDSKMKLAADYLLIYVVPVVLISLMKSAFTPGDSGDWDDPKKIAAKLIKEEVSYLMGMFFGLREVSNIVDAFQAKPSGEYKGPAGTRLIGDTLVLAKQIGQGEMDDGLRKAVINVSGELLRLPSAQINRTITGVVALKEGKTKNPAAIVFGYEQPH